MPVGAERHRPDTLSVWPVSGADGVAGGGVPDPHGVVGAAGDDAVPVGLNATDCTAPVWPVSGAPMGSPVAASQIRTVCVALPETMRVPVGLNATLRTASVWPVSGAPRRCRWRRPRSAPCVS